MSFLMSAGGLLDVAARVLERSHFSVARDGLDAATGVGLLAENEFFALGVLAGRSLRDLAATESLAAEAVLDRIGASTGNAKRWDAYLVLLTPESSATADDRERVRLAYNTRGLRRIVGQGVLPTEESVSRVLTPFLPLREPLESSFGDIGTELAAALEVNGIDLARAERYVSAYLDSGSLENV